MEFMVDTRTCDQCGAVFEPRREHGRFCSARCRVAWNRENADDRAAGGSALEWSISAMRDANWRLLRAQARDRSRAFAVISEAVWWVTIVDGTLVRYHPDAYDALLASYAAEDRQLIEGTLAGLRFVRNRAGQHVDHTDFIRLGAPGDGRVAVDFHARACADLAPSSRSSMGSVPVPRLRGIPGRAHRRGDIRLRGGLPRACCQLDLGASCRRPGAVTGRQNGA